LETSRGFEAHLQKFDSKSGEKLTSTLGKDIETNEKELNLWMDKHTAIYRELETTYNEMSGY
jgi:hypothetical protein